MSLEFEKEWFVVSSKMREALTKLQIGKAVDRHLLQNILLGIKTLTVMLQSEKLIPKAALNEIRSMIKVLNAEAPYFSGETDFLKKTAEEMEFSFDLILMGENHADRVPGVPRIM